MATRAAKSLKQKSNHGRRTAPAKAAKKSAGGTARKTGREKAVPVAAAKAKASNGKAIPSRAAKGKPARPARTVRSSEHLAYTLDALLHSMRCIAQHEDELCTLLHDARRSGRLSASLLRELRSLLQELPGEEYAFDLRAAQEIAEAA